MEKGSKHTKKWIENHKKRMIGRRHSEETKLKISLGNKKSKPHKSGYKHSEEAKLKMSLKKIGKPSPLLGKPSPLKGRKQPKEVVQKRVSKIMGENHPKWIRDREKLISNQKGRRSHEHRKWSNSVKKRDNYCCKIKNCDCFGKLEAHHILSYSQYPELRYDINNGITLCKYHHPKKKEDELLFQEYFKTLITI